MFKFRINTIFYLSFIVLTIISWLFLEIYAKQNDVEIDPVLNEASQAIIPDRYDEQILKEFYNSKSLFYEIQENEVQ